MTMNEISRIQIGRLTITILQASCLTFLREPCLQGLALAYSFHFVKDFECLDPWGC